MSLLLAVVAAMMMMVITTMTAVYAQIILNNTTTGTTATNATAPSPLPLQQQQQQEQEREKRLIIFANTSTVKSAIMSALNFSDVTYAANYENGTGVVIFKRGPSNTSEIEIHFNHTCIPSNGCIYKDNTISVENNDTHMEAIQTEE